MQNQGLTVPDRNICWYTTQELDDFRQSRDLSFLKKFLERITPDCTAFICEDDFIAWLLWEELSLGNTLALKREKRIATHAPLSSSLQNTGFKAASADHNFETTIALAAFNTSYLTTSGLLRATTLTHQTHQPGTLAAHMSINKLKGLPVSSQEVPWQLSLPKSHN